MLHTKVIWDMEIRAVVKVVGETLFLYGLLGWGFGVIVFFTKPELLEFQVSHLTPWLRQDTFTILSFIASMIGFFFWRLAKESK
jgi:hypothetical protein